jgi:hypothetical protein
MKQEKTDELKRMLSLINHKESTKIRVNEALNKAVSSGILNEIDDIDIADFDFGELEKEKDEFELNVGQDPKYYAENSTDEEAPKANRIIFSLPYRCWLLGMSSGTIKLKVNAYNAKYPEKPIEYNEDEFKGVTKPSIGLLGDGIKMNELNKYCVEFYARVASKNLNPKEEEFDKATSNSFSSPEAINFAQQMLNKWIYVVVTDQVRKLTKATFKDEVDIRVFDEGKEKGIEKINLVLNGKYPGIKFDAKKANFNAFAVEVMKNSVKNAFIKYGKVKTIDSGDLYDTIKNLSFPYGLKTTAQYTVVLKNAFAKKLGKKKMSDFTTEDWEIIKKETNSSFVGEPKMVVDNKKVYLMFKYNSADDLISDIISANNPELAGEESRSYSPTYYKNILDSKIKSNVFKSTFSPTGRDIDAMMGAVELKPTQPEGGEPDTYDDDMEYDIEREKEFPTEFEFPGVPEGVTRDQIANFLKSNKFISDFKPFVEQFSKKRLYPLFNKIDKPEFAQFFSKYPEALEAYKKLLGDMLYYSLIEIPDEAGLKNKYLEKVSGVLKKLRTTVKKKDISTLKSIFSFTSDNIQGFNQFKTILSKDMDVKTKRRLFSDLISEAKRTKKLAKILKEFRIIINEAESGTPEVSSMIQSLTGTFSKQFNSLNDKEKSLLIDKAAEFLSGKFSRTMRFSLQNPANKLLFTLLVYVITNSSVDNENFKNNAFSALLSILYNRVDVLKFIAKQGTSRSKTPIEYKDSDYAYKYEDVVLDSISKKIQEIRNSNNFDPSKSDGLTWLINILSNDVADYFTSLEGAAKFQTRSIDAPSPSTGKSVEIGDEEENKFQWFQRGDAGELTGSEIETGTEDVADVTPEPGSGKGFEKMLQSISSKFGFGLKQFIKNKFSANSTFSYTKGGNSFQFMKNGKPVNEQEFAIYMLEFMSGYGEPEYYAAEGGLPKYNKFVDFLVKDKGLQLFNATTGNPVELDDKEDNDETSVRPNRVTLFRIKDKIQSLIQDRIKAAKEKGSMYESVKKEINPIIKKYFLIKESKKKDIELEEERIANSDGKEKVNNKENFIGSQVFGEDIGKLGEKTGWQEGLYGVFSYGLQFPIYVYTNQEFTDQDGNVKNKDGKFRWFHNIEDYKFDIDDDGENEVMKSVQKHKELLKPSSETHGLTRATLVGLIKKFMKKNKIQNISHTSIKPGEGAGIHYGDSDHGHDKRKEKG